MKNYSVVGGVMEHPVTDGIMVDTTITADAYVAAAMITGAVEMNMREFYERQVEFYKGFIEFDEWNIKRLNREIKESRKQDREIVEYVWSKGPLDRWHHEIYTEGYVSCSTRDLVNKRAKAYRQRKYDERQLKKYEQELARYEGR